MAVRSKGPSCTVSPSISIFKLAPFFLYKNPGYCRKICYRPFEQRVGLQPGGQIDYVAVKSDIEHIGTVTRLLPAADYSGVFYDVAFDCICIDLSADVQKLSVSEKFLTKSFPVPIGITPTDAESKPMTPLSTSFRVRLLRTLLA